MSEIIELNADASQFVAPCADGGDATLKMRQLDDQTIEYYSTFVPVACRGSGIGARLVIHGLNWARDQGYKIVPTCSFVERVIESRPEYRALKAE